MSKKLGLSEPGYVSVRDLKKRGVAEQEPILNEEDEATLAAIDRGIKAADEGRVVSSEEAQRRLREWLTKSSLPKTRSWTQRAF